MKGHGHIVSSCNFCVDDTRLLSGSYDCTVKLWVGGPVLGGDENILLAYAISCGEITNTEFPYTQGPQRFGKNFLSKMQEKEAK